jgi:hypothetical protein
MLQVIISLYLIDHRNSWVITMNYEVFHYVIVSGLLILPLLCVQIFFSMSVHIHKMHSSVKLRGHVHACAKWQTSWHFVTCQNLAEFNFILLMQCWIRYGFLLHKKFMQHVCVFKRVFISHPDTHIGTHIVSADGIFITQIRSQIVFYCQFHKINCTSCVTGNRRPKFKKARICLKFKCDMHAHAFTGNFGWPRFFTSRMLGITQYDLNCRSLTF